MPNICWALLLFIATTTLISRPRLIAHAASPKRHCDDLSSAMVTCPALCNCCLRNSLYDDTSLVIDCNQYDKQQPSFTSDLIAMLQGLKAANIILKLFDLRSVRLESIPNEICATTSLEELHLVRLHLTNVLASCIQQLRHLRVLNLEYNEITRLPNDMLYGLTELVEVRLPNNLLVDVQPEVFYFAQNMTKMEVIDFSYNKLTSLDMWPLFFIRDILNINLAYNNISTFTNRLHYKIRCASQLRKGLVELESNNVQHLLSLITGYGLKGLHDPNFLCLTISLDYGIRLNHNPLICDCVDYQVYLLMKLSQQSLSIDSMYCAQPPALKDQQLIKVLQHMEQFVCDIQDDCPPQCACFTQPYTNALVVQCNDRKLSELATTLPTLPHSTSRFGYYVNYSHNSIVNVPARYYYYQSTTIRLDHNHIQSIDDRILTSMANVTELYLNNNLLTTLPPQVANLKWPNLVAIHLYDNPWSCDCHSLWIKHWLASLGTAVVVNLNAITCSTDDVRNGRSVTVVSDADFVCGHIMSTTEMMWITLPTVAGSVIGVLSATVITLYAKRKWLYKRFKLHPFDVDECDGEHMTYDVFLSSADEDTGAIMALYRELIQLGYRVCYHKIDFIAGLPTTDNIDSAITHSKRTLCYVTRSFVQSDWCKWEFENALNRDLTNKRHRLVVIVDEHDVDVTAIAYCSMRQYLQTYTYIERHSEDFIHALMYSLAQRKLGEHQEQEGQVIAEERSQADHPLIDIS